MKKLSIKVEQRHINSGRRLSPASCPVALACRDAGMGDPLVFQNGRVNYLVGGTMTNAHLPKDINTLISLYDLGAEMRPFEFEIEVPE